VTFWNLNLPDMLIQGCNSVREYLQSNSRLSQQDKSICEGIESKRVEKN
jgi:hypothetical protein